MNPGKNIPSRKPAKANQIYQTLPNHRSPLHNRTNNDGELVSAKVPTDANIGRSNNIRGNIATALTTPVVLGKYELNPMIKRTASSELLKIEGLNNYMGACAAYERGLKKGWEEETLLRLVEEWHRMDRGKGQA